METIYKFEFFARILSFQDKFDTLNDVFFQIHESHISAHENQLSYIVYSANAWTYKALGAIKNL